MKKQIILTALAILFLYPIISIMQMAFAGSFDLTLLKRDAILCVFTLVFYFYILWALSTKSGLITQIIIMLGGLIVAIVTGPGTTEEVEKFSSVSVDWSEWRMWFFFSAVVMSIMQAREIIIRKSHKGNLGGNSD